MSFVLRNGLVIAVLSLP